MPIKRQSPKAMKNNMINKDIDKKIVVMDEIMRDKVTKPKKKAKAKKAKKAKKSMKKGC